MPTPHQLLTFEQQHPKHTGWKEERIRTELGLTPARYYQLTHRAAVSVEGQAADPITARAIRERLLKTDS